MAEKENLLVNLNDITEKEASWLVPQRMPKGQITFLNRYEQQYEKETVEDVRISRISKQGFAEMEANKQKKADQEPVELVNADGVHVTAQSNGTNSAAAYFAKNYSNCMNQKTTEPED